MKDVKAKNIGVGGDDVAVTVFEPNVPNGYGLLFINGWRSEQTGNWFYADSLAEDGFTVLTFDFRGMGKSSGDIRGLTRSDYLDDCLAAYDALCESVAVKKVLVAGASFGSYLACLLAARRRVTGLALRVPANYPNDGFDEQPQLLYSDALDVEGWRFETDFHKDSLALVALREFDGPTLMVQSEDDRVVHRDTSALFRSAASTYGNLSLVEMKGAPHGLVDVEFKDVYRTILRSWCLARITDNSVP